jgi:hypothetical protein
MAVFCCLEDKTTEGASMKKTTPVLSLLTTLLWGQALHAETYTYTGPNFTDVAGGYTTSMSVTASITTSAPIPPNETGYDILSLVTNWSMSDGVNTLQIGPDSYLYALVDTDSAGHIVGALIGATYALSVPPLIGDTVDDIFIRSNPPTNFAADDMLCIADDGEQCTSYDSSASFGWVEGYGTWTGDHVFEDGFEGGQHRRQLVR